MRFPVKTLSIMALPLFISACSSLNPVGNGDFSCPGMPMGVTCKTPAAVYKSSNGTIAPTEFDEVMPGAKKAQMESAQAPIGNFTGYSTSTNIGPRPVREPAQVVRIWIAPWIDKSDNLNLASYQYTEIAPRTWSLGKTEASVAGYVIPHKVISSTTPVAEAAVVANRTQNTIENTAQNVNNAVDSSAQQARSAFDSVTPSNNNARNSTGFNLPR